MLVGMRPLTYHGGLEGGISILQLCRVLEALWGHIAAPPAPCVEEEREVCLHPCQAEPVSLAGW